MKLFAAYPGFENIQGEHLDNSDKKVAVVLFPGVEIIDFSGPWEVFGAAGMDVFSVAASDSILTTGMGLNEKNGNNTGILVTLPGNRPTV